MCDKKDAKTVVCICFFVCVFFHFLKRDVSLKPKTTEMGCPLTLCHSFLRKHPCCKPHKMFCGSEGSMQPHSVPFFSLASPVYSFLVCLFKTQKLNMSTYATCTDIKIINDKPTMLVAWLTCPVNSFA